MTNPTPSCPEAIRRRTTSLRAAGLAAILAFAGLAGPTRAQDAASPAAGLRPYVPGTPQLGVGGTPDRPARAILRQDEDWSWLGRVSPAERPPLAGAKRVPLGPGAFATFAFDGRMRMESFEDRVFGEDPGRDATWHVRADPHLALSFGERVRLYGALKYASVGDERFPASPVDEQDADLHQAFAELSMGDLLGRRRSDVFLRVGRQELHYGAGRLISIRNGPNLRQDFDGAMVRGRWGATVADALAFRPTEDEPGPFDNDADETEAVWGVYTSTDLGAAWPEVPGLLGRAHLDLYYLGQRREESLYAFQAPPVDETRHTLGARLWTAGALTDGWNADLEGALQLGQAKGIIGADREASIRAGLLAGNVSYGFADAPWTPVVALRAGVGTGDGDPSDDRLGTYRAPYPSGRYFGDSNPLGPGNIAALAPALTVSPLEDLAITGRIEAFWRASDEDGLYSTGVVPVRGGAGNERFVGHEWSLAAEYALSDTVTLDAVLAHFETGSFFDVNPPGEDITYVRVSLDVVF